MADPSTANIVKPVTLVKYDKPEQIQIRQERKVGKSLFSAENFI